MYSPMALGVDWTPCKITVGAPLGDELGTPTGLGVGEPLGATGTGLRVER